MSMTIVTQVPRHVAGKHIPWIVIPHDQLKLDAADAAFYRECDQKSRDYVAQESARHAYLETAVALPLIHVCMDEREQDVEEALGLPPGVANLVPTAGNKIGGLDEPNLVLFKEMHEEQQRAGSQGMLHIVLFVTHHSSSYPQTESCAAWQHDVEAADRHASQQVTRINEFYLGRDLENGRPLSRKVVAFHLRSDTDTEARAWIGHNGHVLDPVEFAAYAENGGGLEGRVLSRCLQAFPSTDPRFSGLEAGLREALLKQIAAMLAANARVVRRVISSRRPTQKLGHQGTRILVGRGWESLTETNCYFKFSDYSIGEDELMSGTYVIRNGVLEMLRTGKPFSVPFHVNTPYALGDLTDRGASINHSLALARDIRNKWLKRIRQDPALTDFRNSLLHALRIVEPGLTSLDDLPSSVREYCFKHLADALRFFVSVSPRQTRLIEVVATEADL